MKHPVHPMLVHFPVASWSFATFGDILSLQYGAQAWRFSGNLHILGTLTAIAVMITGLIEFSKIRSDNPAIKTAHRHMLCIMATWSCYAVSLFARLNGFQLTAPDFIAIGFSIAGFLLLCIAGRLGGKLVYEYGVGIQNFTATARQP